MDILHAIIIAIVEGLTEFLPVSSTGHMIITQKLLGVPNDGFVPVFIVGIQFGAILSVVFLYFRQFFKSTEFYFKLFAAFLPAAFFGILLSDYIDAMLENVIVVAISLLVGGIILIFIDKWIMNPAEDAQSHISKKVSYGKAIRIGFFQCIAMIPGVSRSAATIIGGMIQKLDRKTAAEFSFFLAVPTMFAATAKKIYDGYLSSDATLIKAGESIPSEQIQLFLIGNLVAFIVAMLAIKFFISFLTKYGFKIFGYYRIALGAILLILAAMGIELSIL